MSEFTPSLRCYEAICERITPKYGVRQLRPKWARAFAERGFIVSGKRARSGGVDRLPLLHRRTEITDRTSSHGCAFQKIRV